MSYDNEAMSTLIAGAGGCKNFKLFPCFKVSTHIFIYNLKKFHNFVDFMVSGILEITFGF